MAPFAATSSTNGETFRPGRQRGARQRHGSLGCALLRGNHSDGDASCARPADGLLQNLKCRAGDLIDVAQVDLDDTPGLGRGEGHALTDRRGRGLVQDAFGVNLPGVRVDVDAEAISVMRRSRQGDRLHRLETTGSRRLENRIKGLEAKLPHGRTDIPLRQPRRPRVSPFPPAGCYLPCPVVGSQQSTGKDRS